MIFLNIIWCHFNGTNEVQGKTQGEKKNGCIADCKWMGVGVRVRVRVHSNLTFWFGLGWVEDTFGGAAIISRNISISVPSLLVFPTILFCPYHIFRSRCTLALIKAADVLDRCDSSSNYKRMKDGTSHCVWTEWAATVFMLVFTLSFPSFSNAKIAERRWYSLCLRVMVVWQHRVRLIFFPVLPRDLPATLSECVWS